MTKQISFRHTASFGKRAEYFIIAQMLKEGLREEYVKDKSQKFVFIPIIFFLFHQYNFCTLFSVLQELVFQPHIPI